MNTMQEMMQKSQACLKKYVDFLNDEGYSEQEIEQSLIHLAQSADRTGKVLGLRLEDIIFFQEKPTLFQDPLVGFQGMLYAVQGLSRRCVPTGATFG